MAASLSLTAASARGAAFEWGHPFSLKPGVGYMEIPADWQNGGTISGSALPYPATIKVFGIPKRILSMRFGFGEIVHTGVRDMDVLLVGPGGQHAMVMSDACGAGTLDIDFLTFDDSASTVLPSTATCAARPYRPANYAPSAGGFPQTVDGMPAPAPPIPGGSLAYSPQLSAFTGTNPNGVWRLFVQDDGNTGTGGGIGVVASWAIEFHLPARCRGRKANLVGVNRRGDFLRGGRRRDVIQSFGGPDLLNGKKGRDLLCAGKGRDVVYGGKGRDVLIGGKGPDKLFGEQGRDLCIGGPGRDKAVGCERTRGI